MHGFVLSSWAFATARPAVEVKGDHLMRTTEDVFSEPARAGESTTVFAFGKGSEAGTGEGKLDSNKQKWPQVCPECGVWKLEAG